MEIALIWIGLSVIVGLIGQNKELGCAGAFFISLLLSPLVGLIVVAVSSSKKNQAQQQPHQTGNMEPEKPAKKECPYCGFVDESGAQFCPACERDSTGKTKEHYKRMAEDPEYKKQVEEEEEQRREEERKEQERIKDEEEKQVRLQQEKKRRRRNKFAIAYTSVIGAIILSIVIGNLVTGSEDGANKDEVTTTSSSENRSSSTSSSSSSSKRSESSSLSGPLKMGRDYHNGAFSKKDYEEIIEAMKGMTRIQTEKYYLGLRSGHKLKITQKDGSKILDKMQKDLTNKGATEGLSSVKLDLSTSATSNDKLIFLGKTEKGDRVSVFFELTDAKEGVVKIQCCGESRGKNRYNLVDKAKVKTGF